MARVNLSASMPLKFEFGKIHMIGGHAHKAYPATSKTVVAPHGESVTGVRVAVSEMRLTAAPTGQCTNTASCFGHTPSLDEIRRGTHKAL